MNVISLPSILPPHRVFSYLLLSQILSHFFYIVFIFYLIVLCLFCHHLEIFSFPLNLFFFFYVFLLLSSNTTFSGSLSLFLYHLYFLFDRFTSFLPASRNFLLSTKSFFFSYVFLSVTRYLFPFYPTVFFLQYFVFFCSLSYHCLPFSDTSPLLLVLFSRPSFAFIHVLITALRTHPTAHLIYQYYHNHRHYHHHRQSLLVHCRAKLFSKVVVSV